MNSASITSLDVKKFQSPSKFLQAHYEERKKNQPNFSYEIWSKELSYKNRSYLRFVVLGQRPVNENLMRLFSKYFGFSTNSEDAEYFSTLIHYSQSKSPSQKNIFGKRLLELSTPPADKLEVTNHFDFLSDHYLPVLQTICGFKDVSLDSKTIAPLLDITENEVQQKLDQLGDMGLHENGVPTKRAWKVPSSHQALGHREFYRQSLARAEKSIELPFDERRFQSLFMAFSQEEFTQFLKDFQQFAQEQLKKFDHESLSGRRIYQLNFNFFPETKAKS